MMSMSIVLLLALLGAFLGLALLMLGGYALYESFTKDEGERIFLGSVGVARTLGILSLLAGIVLLVSPLLVLFVVFGVRPGF